MKTAIKNIVLSAALALTTTTLSAAPQIAEISSKTLQPMQAHTISMQDYTTVVYYTVLANGDFQVVTSTGPNAGVDGEMTHNSVTVESGASLVYSLQTAAGKPSVDIRFAANENRLVVASH